MLKVLIADDEALMREALTRTVADIAGFLIVGEAENGEKAIKLSQEHMPDIVFMDIRMPVLDGLKASEQIKYGRPQTEIILLSAHEDFESAKAGIKIGVREYLLKPCFFNGIKQLLIDIRGTRLQQLVLHDGLLKSVAAKQFEASCGMIEGVVCRLFNIYKGTSERYAGFRLLLTDMFGVVPGINRDFISKCGKKYALSDAVCNDPVQAGFWLFDIIDEVFRQRSILLHRHFIKVFDYIDDSLNHEIELNVAACRANLSSSYLSRIFNREMGVSYSNYASIRKVRKAKQILINSELSVNDVAFNVGFNEPNYFCKVFRRFTSSTPTQYRESIRRFGGILSRR